MPTFRFPHPRGGEPPDAGILTGGNYTLGGGFWGGGVAAVKYRVYLPVILRQYP